MKRTEKNNETRSSFLPISIVWIFKIILRVAGFALWGWGFVAVSAGVKLLFAVAKILFLCLVVAIVIGLAVVITF